MELDLSRPGPKQAIFGSLAEVAQALGHAKRLELLEQLAQCERSVEDLNALVGMNFANTSRHLQILRRARLVKTRRQGKYVLYSLAGETEVVTLIRSLGRVGERNVAEISRVLSDYFHARDSMEAVTREDLLGRIADGLVTVLDVRPEDEFTEGHLPGARNIPLAKLHRRLKDLPKDLDIVAYCRGPYCLFAHEAVAALRKKGFKALRLEDGFPEWKAAGLPIESRAAE